MPTPVTRTEISHAVDATWTDVDVSAYVDAGSTAGVILEVVNTTGTQYEWGVRKNGSTDDIHEDIEDYGHTWAAIGVDGDDIFELYLEDASEVDVYIVGYITTDEGAFLTDAVEKTLTNAYAWEDVDISADTGDDTAICAFWLVASGAGFKRSGLRENGSTDDHWGRIFGNQMRGAMMAVDGSEVCELYSDDVDNVHFYLVGWLTDNFTSFTDAKNYQASGTDWEDADLSSDIPANNNGACCHLHVQNTEYAGGIRANGESYDNYHDITEHQHLWVEIDANRVVEQKVENTNLILYVWGYTCEPSEPEAGAVVQIMLQQGQFDGGAAL